MTESHQLVPVRPIRIQAIDWHRGLSVLVMIEGHSLVLLHPSHNGDWLRSFLDVVNGLGAPSFLLLAGVSLGYSVLIGSTDGLQDRRVAAWGRVRTLASATILMRVLGQPVFRDPKWEHWLKVDILGCILGSMLIGMLVLHVVGRYPKILLSLTALAGVGLLVAAPLAEGHTTTALSYFTSTRSGSMFPVFPWGGIVLIGMSCGAALTVFGRRGLRLSLVAMALLFGVLASQTSGILEFMPGPNTWIFPNACQRMWKIAVILLALDAIESGAQGVVTRLSPIFRLLKLAGSESLAAYCIHLCLIFGLFGIPFLSPLQGKCDWPAWFGLAVLTTAATLGSILAWNRWARRGRSKARASP